MPLDPYPLPPVSPAPVSPAPVSLAPVSLAPVSLAPVSLAPVSLAPVSPAPVSPAPVSPAPVSPAPVSLAPGPRTLAPVSFTLDELKRFGLFLQQPKEGYRFTLDPLLLCDFTNAGNEQTIADLGTGCGVMALILARMAPEAQVIAIEKEPPMAALAQHNITRNHLDEQVRLLHDDLLHIRGHLPVSWCDLVVSNPPYRKQGRGRLNPHPGRMAGRHETTASLSDFLTAAKYLIKPSGRICIVYHPARLPEFMAVAATLKLSVRKLRMVHGTPEADAKIFLAELTKGGRIVDTQILPPLVVRRNDQDYTDEVRGILLGEY